MWEVQNKLFGRFPHRVQANRVRDFSIEVDYPTPPRCCVVNSTMNVHAKTNPQRIIWYGSRRSDVVDGLRYIIRRDRLRASFLLPSASI